MSKTTPPQDAADFDPLAQPQSAPLREDDFEREVNEDIQKGMAPRNLKRAAMTLVAFGLVGYFAWDHFAPKSPPSVPPPPVVQDERVNPGSVVTDLEKQAEEPLPPPSVQTSGSMNGGLAPTSTSAPSFQPPGMPAGAQTNQKSAEDERIQLALISSMSAEHVQLRNQQQGQLPTSALDQRLRQSQQEIQSAQERIRREAQADIDRMLGASGGPAPQGLGSTGALGGFDASMLGQQAGDGSRMVSHQGFIAQQRATGIEPPSGLEPSRHPDTLYEGTLIRTVTTRRLDTTLPGMLTAKVTSDVYDSVTQRSLLIPRGSEVTCRYQSEIRYGQKRLLAACTRLRMPNGESFSLAAAPASGLDGTTGVAGRINNHFFEMFGTALVVGAASYLLPKEDRKINVAQGDSGTTTGGTIMGSALSKVIDNTIARNTTIPPTGTLEIGTPFTLTLSRDVEFTRTFTGR